MTDLPAYSTLFACLYDEAEPIGRIGRGTHYSVFRAVDWRGDPDEAMFKAQHLDFAAIWDEDHDARIIEVIEEIYMAGMLPPVRFIGERKGTLAVLLDADSYCAMSDREREAYRDKIAFFASLATDQWTVELGCFDGGDGAESISAGIIADDKGTVDIYLKNIANLWRLGSKPYVRGGGEVITLSGAWFQGMESPRAP